MGQSLAKNFIHLVYSTKYRKRWITDDIKEKLHAYQAGVFKQIECPAIVIGGVEDHVHALFNLSKTVTLAKAIEEVKKSSSKWIKTEKPELDKFAWQKGYAAFSVSQSNEDSVREYINNQEEHHATMSFQDELRLLLKRHGMEFSEEYLWDD